MPEDSLISQVRTLIQKNEIDKVTAILSPYQNNDFSLLIQRFNRITTNNSRGIYSPEKYDELLNKLTVDILEQVTEFDKKQLKQQTANITNQKTQVKSIALPAKDYWQVIEDEFIRNLEKYLYMNPQSRSTNSETGVRIFTYYFLEEQIKRCTSCIKTLQELSPTKGGYEKELGKLLRALNITSGKIGRLLDESNNGHSEIRSDLLYIYERSDAMRNKLLESISSDHPKTALSSLERVDKPQLIITLKRLLQQLEEKKKIAVAFSKN